MEYFSLQWVTLTWLILRLATAAQDFLEATPYWDPTNVTHLVYTKNAPLIGKVVSVTRIVGPTPTAHEEIVHIVIAHSGKFTFWEGQSLGIIPPGYEEMDGQPYSARFYTIASTRYGDDMKGSTLSLCVRRVTYWSPYLRAVDPAKKGVCSNFLADSKPGDEIMMTGPYGEVMLLPEKDPTTDFIFVSTGTGIAPYRGFIRRLFTENTPAGRAFKGSVELFLIAVPNVDDFLYDNEWQEVMQKFPNRFRLGYYMFSQQMKNKTDGKMYIDDKLAKDTVQKLGSGAHIYFCGLKGMMREMLDVLKNVTTYTDIDFEQWLKALKKKKQWHVEVY